MLIRQELPSRTMEQSEATSPVVRVAMSAVLSPGGNAQAVLRLFDPITSDYVNSSITVTVYDSDNQNYLLANEVVRVRRMPDSGRYEIVGSNGLLRKAKADAQISYDSSGTVSIWANGADSTNDVTAHLNWAHNDENISSGKELLVKYFPDESKWVIVGKECE